MQWTPPVSTSSSSSAASSQADSFVLVDRNGGGGEMMDASGQGPALLASLAPYFLSVQDSSLYDAAWPFNRVQQVKDARKSRPDRRLFIDELLALVQLDGSAVYPPTSSSALHQLLYQLLSHPAALQAHCILFYFLLSDNRYSPTPSAALPTAFCRDFLLPAGFVRSVEGFHALDEGDFRAAVSALTDPRLTPDFVPKTFALLGSDLPDRHTRAALVLSFWRLSGVALQSLDEAKVVAQALCDHQRRHGVAEAWRIQREWAEDDERKVLAQTILKSCFGDNLFGKPVPHHLQTLLTQPFTAEEDEVVNAFCLAPLSSAVSKTLTADWRLSKYIAEARPVDALRFWAKVKSDVNANDERDRLLKAVYATLTDVQRSTLALEADDVLDEGATATAAGRASNGIDSTTTGGTPAVDITRSAWQPLPVPMPQAPPRSLASLRVQKQQQAAPSPSKITPQNLPLSASPFLRKERPLVSSEDGGAVGGVQKSVLKALKDGASPMKTKSTAVPPTADNTQRRGDTPSASSALFFMRNSPAPASPRMQLDGASAPASPSKPTLSGFGSVRQPFAITSYGRATPVKPVSAPSQHEVEEESEEFGYRAANDPSIAATIAAATTHATAQQSTAPPTGSKRRNVSNSGTQSQREKRRAVSTEAEDRPRAEGPPEGSKSKVPPGAFPGQAEEDAHDEDEDSQRPPNKSDGSSRRKTSSRPKATGSSSKKAGSSATATRRSTRASSVQPGDEAEEAASRAKVAPKSARKSASTMTTTAAPETPRVRRSSRLQTPAKDKDASNEGQDAEMSEVRLEGREKPSLARSARRAGGRGGRSVIDEEEEDD